MKKYRVRPFSILFNLQIAAVAGLLIASPFIVERLLEVLI